MKCYVNLTFPLGWLQVTFSIYMLKYRVIKKFIKREKLKPPVAYESYKFRLNKTLKSYLIINEVVEKQTDQKHEKGDFQVLDRHYIVHDTIF